MAKHEKEEMRRRKGGGRVGSGSDKEWDGENGEDAKDDGPHDVYSGGESNVAKEARGEMANRHERKRGGKVEAMHGEANKRRLDRPGRKRGGGVGADTTPLSTASRTHDRRDGGSEAAITGGA